MNKRTTISLVAALALLSVSAPAFARHHDHGYNKKVTRQYHKQVKRSYKRNKQFNRQVSRWEWNKHNWNDQRNYLRSNWRARRAQITAAQRAQLDEQLRAQWLTYHNNSWNGAYTWDQYSDPAFLDYVHNNNPTLMTMIRTIFGF